MDSTICRVCFKTNVKLHCITEFTDIVLQEMYLLIACTQLNIKDGSPITLCYLCCSQLQRCYRFSQMAQTAEKTLAGLASMIEITQYTDLTNEKMMHNLSISPVKLESMDDHIEVSVKEEIVEDKKPAIADTNLIEVSIKIEQPDPVYDLPDASGLEHAERDGQSFINKNNDYNCHLCGKTYATKHSILIHMGKAHDTTNTNSYSRNMSDPDGRPYTCKECNKKFKKFSYFKLHSRIHNTYRPFACSHCNKTFVTKRDLNTHMRIHIGVRPHACERCGKSFFRRDNLQKHMRYHTGEKPFCCEQCDKTFYINSALKRHMATHSGDKPYSCNLCDKSFNQNKYLHSHMITHSNEKPHECQLCKKTFRRKNDLKVHMISHTGEKSFACQLCGKTFIHKYHLQRHLKTHNK